MLTLKHSKFKKLHPVTFILIWIAFALALPMLKLAAMLVCMAILLMVIIWLRAKEFLVLLRRTRWIMFTLFMVYAYTTPGETGWSMLGMFSPTQEGVFDGLMQIGRLVCALAALSILLAALPQSRFIAGLYTLVYPLRWFGVSRERMAVRLALTLEFAETAMRETADDWKSSIEHVFSTPHARPSPIELYVQPFGWRDGMLLVFCAIVLSGLWR
jgi:energy-coupling factor transport system permease protein